MTATASHASTTFAAYQAWADLPATEIHEWTATGENRYGESTYQLRDQGIVVSAAAMADGRYQVFVDCQCPGSLHAFPTDTLEDAAQLGLTVCTRMSQRRAGQRAAR